MNSLGFFDIIWGEDVDKKCAPAYIATHIFEEQPGKSQCNQDHQKKKKVAKYRNETLDFSTVLRVEEFVIVLFVPLLL